MPVALCGHQYQQQHYWHQLMPMAMPIVSHDQNVMLHLILITVIVQEGLKHVILMLYIKLYIYKIIY